MGCMGPDEWRVPPRVSRGRDRGLTARGDEVDARADGRSASARETAGRGGRRLSTSQKKKQKAAGQKQK